MKRKQSRGGILKKIHKKYIKKGKHRKKPIPKTLIRKTPVRKAQVRKTPKQKEPDENRYKLTDLKAVFIFAVLLSIIIWAIHLLDHTLLSYILISVFLGAFIALVALSVRKFGSVLVFMLLVSLLSFGADNIGIQGWGKISVFLIAGLLFEIVFLLFRFTGETISTIISALISFISIPVSIGLILSFDVMKELTNGMMNICLNSSVFGVLGAIIGLVIWAKVKNTMLFVRLRYGP
ncbi:hypothetical protein ACFL96_16150 [Thermoproteota archaeon]